MKPAGSLNKILAAENPARHLDGAIIKQRAKRCMRIPPVWLPLGASIGALFLTGCATITRGTSEQLMIQSEPSGATVRLSNGFTGVTPAIFTVPRKGDVIVKVTKEGYEDAELILKSQLSGKGTAGFVGNVLIGGIIGGGIDVATGATLSHVPNPVHATLVPKAAPAAVVITQPAKPADPAAPPPPVPPAAAAPEPELSKAGQDKPGTAENNPTETPTDKVAPK
jgi:hypothetical protein